MSDQQRSLFETEAPPWELDDAQLQCVASVVLPSGPTDELAYLVPEPLRGSVVEGGRVRVPLGRGNRLVVGYCVSVEYRSLGNRRLKDIQQAIDERSLVSPAMLRLTRWMAEYYLCRWGQVLDTVVPAGVRGRAGTRLSTLLSVVPDAMSRREHLKLTEKQAGVLDYLARHATPMTPRALAAAARCTQAPISALRRKGLIISEVRRISTSPQKAVAQPTEPHLQLNADQQLALEAILGALKQQQHETVLMHGITGSGKTEVYIQAIQEVVSYGRQAIVLVPEISLTPQTVGRFRSRFGDVAVLHSHLSDVERHCEWTRIADGDVQVIVGARSAVFAPTPYLGLMVIDEEHETSFKQDTAPRYHAREVARRRAEDEKIPLVLGSATPSLESYCKAREGIYRLIRLPQRVFGRPLPTVNTIDMRVESHDRSAHGAISRPLHIGMQAALREGGQVMLLLNRRGFSTHIQCPSCGEPALCPACEIALTHHKHQRLAICHYCDYRQRVPDRCPHCDFAGMRFSGRGTQKLEAEVRAGFPAYECLRMDTDSMQRPGSHEAALARFRSGEVQILLGTQMIAKGLDFPNVTLVGVINADTALHLPDFRAAERTFQLVTQVAGRTGRGERGGHVLVQTLQPDHSAIRAATKHDYELFASQELPLRKTLGYPPYGAMVRILVRGAAEPPVASAAAEIGDQVRRAGEREGTPVRVLGPAAAPFAKLRGNYRYAIQIQSDSHAAACTTVKAATECVKLPRGVQVAVDVDPLDML